MIPISILAVAFLGTSLVFEANRGENGIFDGTLSQLAIGSVQIDVAVADSFEERVKGLSGLPELGKNRGLIFAYSHKDTHGIWMKDMHFPIDIIWLDEELRVVDIEKDVSPDTYPETFRPETPARYVLEVNAGFAEKHDVNIGTVAVWSSR